MYFDKIIVRESLVARRFVMFARGNEWNGGEIWRIITIGF